MNRHDLAIGSDDDGRGDTREAVRGEDGVVHVDEARHHEGLLGPVLAGRLDALLTLLLLEGVDAEHIDRLARLLRPLGELRDEREAALARAAPLGPEVDDDHATLEIGEADGLALEGRERERGSGVADLDGLRVARAAAEEFVERGDRGLALFAERDRGRERIGQDRLGRHRDRDHESRRSARRSEVDLRAREQLGGRIDREDRNRSAFAVQENAAAVGGVEAGDLGAGHDAAGEFRRDILRLSHVERPARERETEATELLLERVDEAASERERLELRAVGGHGHIGLAVGRHEDDGSHVDAHAGGIARDRHRLLLLLAHRLDRQREGVGVALRGAVRGGGRLERLFGGLDRLRGLHRIGEVLRDIRRGGELKLRGAALLHRRCAVLGECGRGDASGHKASCERGARERERLHHG